MTKLYTSLVLLLFFYSVNAQNGVVVKGSVYDIETQAPLELATIYFSTVKDSAVIEYATSNKKGEFKLEIKKYDKPVYLKVNYVGYQPYEEEQKGLLESKDFGKIYLLRSTNELKEVVINSAPPIQIKKDTIEYNASSFKVRPDANVELLLKQLPGFEVDSDGNVTVNGKNVSQYLVNGKAFFSKDGAILLKNMPADMIKKIQVSDLKTKKEELAKQEASSDDSSINFTIDEKKNKGYFGKFLAGYGTDDRYETSAILNYFNNKRKISLLAASNNINSSGFNQDEIFDSMGGGRNNKGSSRSTGTGKGITQTNLVGLNYVDSWSKDFDTSASYNFSNSVNTNNSHSNQSNFLPTSSFFTESDSKTRSENTGNKANFEFEYKISPTIRLVVTPTINQTRNNNDSQSSSSSKDENNAALNESTSKSNNESNSSTFGNTINFNKSFEKKARNLSFVLSNNNSDGNSAGINVSKTIFYQGGKPNDERNQNIKTDNTYGSYSADIEYTEPITDSLRVRVGTDFNWINGVSDLKTFNFDSVSNSYSAVNNLQTNYTSYTKNSIAPKVGLTFEKSNFTFSLNGSTSIIDFVNRSLYLAKNTDLNQKYVLPYGRAQIRYKVDRSKYFTLRYEYSNSLPSSTQLLPVANLSNPLNTVVGNPDLNPNVDNSLNISFKNYNIRTRSGYTLFMRGDYYNSQVVSSSEYDSSGKRYTTYKNVTGTYTTSIGGNWSQTLKKEANVFRYGLGINANYSLDKGFTNTVLYDAKSLGFSPKVYFSYDYGELLTIAPSYNMSYNESKYMNSALKASSNVVHQFNIQTTNYWPKNWVFGNDFGYTYNSNISNDFKKDFYLWNTSLSYLFLDKKMTLKVKVYDVLNQNQSATRTISPTTIRDEENTVLKRYAMFSLAYKLGSFGGKESNRSRNGRGGGTGRDRGMDSVD